MALVSLMTMVCQQANTSKFEHGVSMSSESGWVLLASKWVFVGFGWAAFTILRVVSLSHYD